MDRFALRSGWLSRTGLIKSYRGHAEERLPRGLVGSQTRHATFDCDVIVAGGGPAGSTAAAWLARAGRSVMLFERDQFPRFHIGESLLASINDVVAEIGADAAVRAAGFPQKWGATFMLADGSQERYADFGAAPDVRTPQTWQVPRATFDQLLLRHAASTGAHIHERHRIVEVVFGDDGVTATVQRSEGD